MAKSLTPSQFNDTNKHLDKISTKDFNIIQNITATTYSKVLSLFKDIYYTNEDKLKVLDTKENKYFINKR